MIKKIASIKEKALPILKQRGIIRSSVFGSLVHGQDAKNSDVDILVELPEGTTLFGLIDLKHQLERALGKKVDLLTYRSLHPLLKEKILNEQVQIYGKRD